MRATRLLSVIAVSLLLLVSACGPKATPTQSGGTEPPATDLPASEPPAANAIQILEMEPPLENGLSANDPVMIRVQYSLLESEGKLQVWFERFLDAQCTQPGSGGGPKGGSTLPGGTIVAIEGGSQEYELSLPPIPPVDTAYVGVGVRLWTADEMTGLAEDMSYVWCYEAKAAATILARVAETPGTGPGYMVQNNPGENAVPGTGSISGVVFQDMNGNWQQDPGDRGLAAMEVLLATEDCRVTTASAVTDSTGGYSFPNLQPGRYCVILNHSGTGLVRPSDRTFLQVVANHTLHWGFAVVSDSNPSAGQTISPSLSGGVTIDGAPGANVSVSLSCPTHAYTATTQTGANGSYSFTNLVNGMVCNITATDRASGQTASVNNIVLADDGATNASPMNILAVQPHDPEPGGIAGTVTVGGVPTAGVDVYISCPSMSLGTNSRTNESGNFSFVGLRAGTVCDLSLSYSSSGNVARVTNVTVQEGQTTSVGSVDIVP
jgi:hypothetical protein